MRKKKLKPFIFIPTGGDLNKLLAEIKKMCIEVTQGVMEVIPDTELSLQKKGTCGLVALRVGKGGLGFTGQVTSFGQIMTDEFCAQWSKENLTSQVIGLCEIQDVFQLRKNWNQPRHTMVSPAIKRIRHPSMRYGGFTVGCLGAGHCWIGFDFKENDYSPYMSEVIVFRLRDVE